MPKNIVICCDGTGNEIDENLSNVFKLFRVISKNDKQCVFYDPGVGTLGQQNPWAKFSQAAKSVFGLATGQGLDDNVLDAYRFLITAYHNGDQIYLFGFSRGAYTVRVLAGLIHMLGLLQPEQINLCGYALTAYKRAAGENDLAIAWRFQRNVSSRKLGIKFIGVWDTVSSVMVPRKDRMYWPSMQTLPYTRRNPSVAVFRQAMAIDERRRLFRLNRWEQPQQFVANPFAKGDASVEQDIKQVWFAGVHSDIGGGYAEPESGISKFPLQWMLEEAKKHGLLVNTATQNHLVNGQQRKGSRRVYVAPDSVAMPHDSMNFAWSVLEWIPKRIKWLESQNRRSFLGWYIPDSEPRSIAEDSVIHASVFERIKAQNDYRPSNLPDKYEVDE